MKRKRRRKMKFRDVFNLRFSPKSFMNVREVNLEEIQ